MGLRVETAASDDLSVVILPSKTALRATARHEVRGSGFEVQKTSNCRLPHLYPYPATYSNSDNSTFNIPNAVPLFSRVSHELRELISWAPGSTDRGALSVNWSPVFALAESSARWSSSSVETVARSLLVADRHRGRRRERNKQGKREFLRLDS